MRFNRLSSIAVAATCLAGAAQAQNIHFNEIYASHTGTDDQEFIELVGTPGMSLDNIVVCIVEGQGGGQGTLDRVWDLTGLVMPADGYFVMGNIAVANMDYDLANGPHTTGGVANNIENGTETFYLLNVPNPLDIADLENTLNNTDIDPDNNGNTIFTDDMANFITIENLTMFNPQSGTGGGGVGLHDIPHDCAETIGHDGTFFPAGITRPGDFPNDFCGDTFLDFNNPGGLDQTPGTANPSFVCGAPVVIGDGCSGSGMNTGTPFCSPAALNSTGASTVLSGMTGSGVGSGVHLEMTGGPVGQLAYMLVGNEATAGITVSNGQFCLVGTATAQFFRYNVGGTDMNSIGGFDPTGTWINAVGTSTTGFGFDVPSTIPDTIPVVIMAGDTWHFQGWYRDTAAAAGSSNFSNGLSVTF
jgi:hypothetical protein